MIEHSSCRRRSRMLPLPPSLHQLIRDGLDEVRDRRAVAGLDEGLDWHAGHQLEAVEPGNFAVRKHDPDGVETRSQTRSLRLFLSDVGRDAAHFAVDLWRRALIERGKAQHCVLPNLDLVDVVRLDPGLDREHVGARDNQHDRLAWADDAPDRMHGKLMHAAVPRRADVDALELVLGRNPFFNQLRGLCPDLGQLLAHLAAKILIDLQDLELGFGDFAPGLGDRGDQRSSCSQQPRRVSFQSHKACDWDEVLAPQFAYAFELLTDQLDFPRLAGDLLLEAADLLLELPDALVQLRLLTRARRAAQLEQPSLSYHDPRDDRIGRTRREVLWTDQPFCVVAFGFEPSLSRRELV